MSRIALVTAALGLGWLALTAIAYHRAMTWVAEATDDYTEHVDTYRAVAVDFPYDLDIDVPDWVNS